MSDPNLVIEDDDEMMEDDVNLTQSSRGRPPQPLPTASTKVSVLRKATQQWAEVWQHFTKFTNDEGQIRGRCNYCKKELAADPKINGTSSLNNHMKRCKKSPRVTNTGGSSGGTQTELVLGVDGEGSLGTWKFDQEAVRRAVAMMISIDELPFRFVEAKGFKNCMSVACPRFHMPSRWTIARDCFKIYTELKIELKKLLTSQTSRVCLTTDSWTLIQRENYMCLTVHFVDNNWRLNKKILNFCPIDSHKGEAIGKAIEKCCREWGIEKVFTVTVDNASSNDLALQWLKKKFTIMGTSILGGKYMHMRCMAHIVNLIVTDGLKEVNVSVARVRGAVKYVRASPSRLAKFKACVIEVRLQCKALLCMDVCTRWNPTFLMLNTAEKFERAFEAFDSQDSNYGSELASGDGVPTSRDWEVCRKFCCFLKQFHTLTVKVSGSKYVTSNCFLDHISAMCKTLKEWQNSEDENFAMMAKRMIDKFNKYWGDLAKVNMCVYFAIVFDPTKKFDYLEWLLEMMCSVEETSVLINKIRLALFELFVEYKKLYSEEVGENTTQVLANEGESRLPPKSTSLKSTFKKQKVGVSREADSELVTFLDEKRVNDDSEDYDVLLWWKLNHLRFSILLKIVRDVMVIPISTVASESAFSTGGRVLDAYRSSLTPKIVQALIYSQDWMRSSYDDGEALDVISPIFEPEKNIEQLQEFDIDLNKIATDPVLD